MQLSTRKGLFNLAIETRGYLEEGCNPFANIRPRKFASKPPNYVPLENFQRVFCRAPTLWWKALLALAYTSGGRRDELLNLMWSDIDFETQIVRFVPKRPSEVILAWEPDSEIINNPIRDLKVTCQYVAVNPFTFHDLRRSCITNWSKKLPIQTVQHLAGHSSIETTRRYYLSVQESDLDMARQVQSKVMTSLTNSGQNGHF